MIFAEAVSDLGDYRRFNDATGVPVLANLTEFGKTPAFTVDELRSVGVAIALYPLTAFRAANRAAENVFRTLRTAGTQKDLIDDLQTREELYEYLDYHRYERKLDELFSADTGSEAKEQDLPK
jgi:methylisocitrate lyase